MSSHQRQIVRAILDILAGLDGGLMTDTLLHGEVRVRTRPPATISDYEQARDYCERSNFILGLTGALEVQKWAIDEKGEAMRRQLMKSSV